MTGPGSSFDAGDDQIEPRVSLPYRLLRRPSAVISIVLLLVILLVTIFADLIAPFDPNLASLRAMLRAPGSVHWLGTDDLGRDALSRLLVGTRVSIVAALQAVAIAVAIGLPLGLLAGYRGGWHDVIISRINDAVMSFPPLVLAIVVVGALGPGLRNAMIAVGLVFVPRILRVARGSALAIREETYIRAAEAMGCSATRILFRHMLPNLSSPLIIQVTLTFAVAILAEASLSFLGLGVQSPTPSWGVNLGRAASFMSRQPAVLIANGAAIAVTVLALNLLGDALRDAMSERRA